MSERADGQGAAAGALRWIVANVDRFIPLVDEPVYKRDRGKTLIELAVSVYLYARFTGNHDSEAVRKIIAVLQQVQERPDFADRLMRYPAELIVGADLYTILRLFGHDDVDRRGLIQRAIDAGYVDYVERPPHRVMDVRLTLEWGDFRHTLPDMDALCSLSILARIPSALYLDNDAAYALTHVVMFLYDYGLLRQSKAASLDVASLGRVLSDLIVVYCQERNWDLLGEVLLCCDCIGLPATAVIERGWQAFLGAQRADGAFPGPEKVFSAHAEQDSSHNEADDPQRAFARDYHTTVVGLIATSRHLARLDDGNGSARMGADCLSHGMGVETVRPPIREAGGAVALAIRRTEEGLGRLLDAAHQEAAPASARRYYELLVATWICHTSPSSARRSFAEIARCIGARLAARAEQDTGTLAQIPLTLTAMAAAILSAYGVAPPSLATFVHTVAGVLRGTPGEDALADLELCEKRVLFHRLGLHPAPTLLSSSEVLDYARDLEFTATNDQIDGLLLRINSFAGYGTREAVLDASQRWLGDVLAGLVCHAFRQDDFIRGCALLRAGTYLGMNAMTTFRSCFDFLCLQQRADGTFGFFGPEEAALRVTDPALPDQLDARLPLTLDCIWALREASSDRWRLFSALPRLS